MIVPAGAISPHRLLIVTGHFGTGKTEFSVNLALALARAGEKVMMADLDIVNPYFRSRERREVLEAAGVRLITSSQECADADMPSLPAEILTVLEDRSYRGLLDIGGDPDGARVLARYQPKITAEDYQLLFVSNANRPEVRKAEDAISYLRCIEEVTGLTCGGIVNNTHLCGETTAEEVLRGAELARAKVRHWVAAASAVLFIVWGFITSGASELLPELAGLEEPVFPITIQMKKPWER